MPADLAPTLPDGDIFPEHDRALPPHLLDLLRTVNPADLTWHANHYDGGEHYQRMVLAALNPFAPPPTVSDLLRACYACVEDGAAFGYQGCVGGTARDVWRALLAHFHIAVPHF